jgi:hypothetical protein
MKYFTKKWQQRISDTPDSARTLANEASALYKAEQAKNPISEDFEKQLDFHDARIERAVMDGNDLHLYFNHPGMNPFEYNHIVFKKARIKAKEHELRIAILSTMKSTAIILGMKCICSFGITKRIPDMAMQILQ